MSSDVVLTASLRQNLTSLQSTQQLLDQTQFRLSTGRRVNSAVDDPQNFFAARSLDNRASDLSRILDTIGQSLSSVEQATNGVDGIETLVDQALAVANQAADAANSASGNIQIVGDTDVSGIDTLTDLASIDGGNAETLTFTITDPDDPSNNINLGGGVVTINGAGSIDELIGDINDLNNTVRAQGGDDVIKASLTAAGRIQIDVLNGGNLDINFTDGGASTSDGTALARDLGLEPFINAVDAGTGTAGNALTARITQLAGNAVTLNFFDNGTGTTPGTAAERTDALNALRNSKNALQFSGDAVDKIQIRINGDTALQTTGSSVTGTLQAFIDNINDDNSVNNLIQASYDETTGRFSIRAIDSSVETIELVGLDGGGGANTVIQNTGLGPALTVNDTANNTGTLAFDLGGAASDLAQAESDFNTLLTQIDELVSDAEFRGTNLLQGDSLTTFFNEDRSNSLVTQGLDISSVGIGLQAAQLDSAEAANRLVDDVIAARTTVRGFGQRLSNDLAILSTRESFTSATINTLEGASGKLVNADQNEEGARLLALQTRQQLGVTSLSLASQSQQSVLRLF